MRKEDSKMGTAPAKRSVAQLLECGIVVIDKPCGPSSHEVSAFVRKILHAPKTGHAGTLDPNVSGVLPVLLGEACKLASVFSGSRKSYVCLMRLGKEVPRPELEEAFENFRGRIYQKPPLASAVAKRLRVREIFRLEILEQKGREVLFSVECEAGTYVRNICRDAGELLGCGAQMIELRRTSALGFGEESAITLQQLSDYYWLHSKGKDELLRKALVPIESALKLKKITVAEGAVRKISSGAPVVVESVLQFDEGIAEGELVSVSTGTGQVFCVAKALFAGGEFPEKGAAFAPVRVLKIS
ncbi:MAG: RNA-guided pseudouridylation complex pseudouridine synthase subunit Cbf5 [Candidatus Micrarchaeia archaeon]